MSWCHMMSPCCIMSQCDMTSLCDAMSQPRATSGFCDTDITEATYQWSTLGVNLSVPRRGWCSFHDAPTPSRLFSRARCYVRCLCTRVGKACSRSTAGLQHRRIYASLDSTARKS
ncbi:unnamed protein product [Ixodes pacificus]